MSNPILEQYGVTDMWLFGSYVRGEETSESDLDILVTFDNDHLTLFDFVELQMELSDALGLTVDLVERKGLKPFIGERILQEIIPV